MPMTEASGTTGCFQPMSVTGSIRQRSASASVWAMSCLRSAAPYPAAPMISLPSWSICADDFSHAWPLGWSRGSAASSGRDFSVRAESRTSAVAAPSSAQYRTALVSTAGTWCSSASLSIRTAWAVLSGEPGELSWETTSATMVPCGMASSQRLKRVRGRRYRRPPMARPTSESGPIRTIRTGFRVFGSRVREASSARVTATGTAPPALPEVLAWASDTSLHRAR